MRFLRITGICNDLLTCCRCLAASPQQESHYPGGPRGRAGYGARLIAALVYQRHACQSAADRPVRFLAITLSARVAPGSKNAGRRRKCLVEGKARYPDVCWAWPKQGRADHVHHSSSFGFAFAVNQW